MYPALQTGLALIVLHLLQKVMKTLIYFKSYYYTSCLDSQTSKDFKIIAYQQNSNALSQIIDTNFQFSTGSIRFFKITSTEELVGVAWLNGNIFNIFQLDQSGIKIEKKYTRIL